MLYHPDQHHLCPHLSAPFVAKSTAYQCNTSAPIRTTHHNHLSDPGNGRVRSFTRYDTLMPTRPVPQQPETRYLHWSARGGFAWCAMALYDQLRHPFWTSTRRA